MHVPNSLAAGSPRRPATPRQQPPPTRQACGCWPTTSWPLIRAELHLALARLLADGDAAAAITEARAAHLIYDRLGSPLADASALLLNSLGVPATARPRRADATASLSRRESEVLDLLRDGLSNADIAARQHNSVRTIEHHVSAILTKLGLRSRAEAAAYAASLETGRKN